MTNKAKYSEFCDKHYVPLMLRPFWQDAVCGAGYWDVCLATDAGGNTIGSLVYYQTKYRGLPIIKMPPLTDYSGLWFFYPQNLQKRSSQYGFEAQVGAELIQQLPKVAFFQQQWHPAVTNWLPFLWQNFQQSTLYTYSIPDLKDTTAVFNDFKSTVKTNIRKAEKLVNVDIVDDITTLYRLYNLSFQKTDSAPPYPFETVSALYNVLQLQQCVRIYLGCEKVTGTPQAALCVAWDEKTAYFLLWGIDYAAAESRALQLLFWRAIQDFSTLVENIDFCGSIVPAVERAIRSFGGVLTPHFKITKTPHKLLKIAGILLNKEV